MVVTENGLPNAPGTVEHWLQRWWRPAMAWQYWLVCLCDFVIFPIFNAAFYAVWNKPYHDWHPLTLQGGGLYHIAMGAVVGVTAYQRSQEKLAVLNYGGGINVAEHDEETVMPTRSSRAD